MKLFYRKGITCVLQYHAPRGDWSFRLPACIGLRTKRFLLEIWLGFGLNLMEFEFHRTSLEGSIAFGPLRFYWDSYRRLHPRLRTQPDGQAQ